MLDHFDGSFQANDRNWKLLPNVAEDRALFDKTGFYSERVKNLIGLPGIEEIDSIFKISKRIKQVLYGNNPFKIGFDGMQYFAAIPKDMEITHSTLPDIFRNYPIIFCRGTFAAEKFGVMANRVSTFNPEYFPDAAGKRIEFCRDYLLFTQKDMEHNNYIEELLSNEDFINRLLGGEKSFPPLSIL